MTDRAASAADSGEASVELAEAIGWATTELERQGTPPAGVAETIHQRPWSTVVRFPLRSGAAYLKLLPAGLRHEVEVTRLLAAWVPERVVRVLASNAARGWLLMAEGGRRAREEIRDREDLHRWADAVREYADLQIRVGASSGRAPRRRRTGSPSRTGPARFRGAPAG